MSGHNFEKLKLEICRLSVSNEFMLAKKEWAFIGAEIVEDWDSCLCGQPIKELCYIRNRVNGKIVYVGNLCVNRFIGINSKAIFDGLKRIIKNPGANSNKDVIWYAYKSNVITDRECDFLTDMLHKRILSIKQAAWKRAIHAKIINRTLFLRNFIKLTGE